VYHAYHKRKGYGDGIIELFTEDDETIFSSEENVSIICNASNRNTVPNNYGFRVKVMRNKKYGVHHGTMLKVVP